MRDEKSAAVGRVIRRGLRQACFLNQTVDVTVFIDQWQFDQTGISLAEAAQAMDELQASGLIVSHALYTVGGDCWRIEVSADRRRAVAKGRVKSQV